MSKIPNNVNLWFISTENSSKFCLRLQNYFPKHVDISDSERKYTNLHTHEKTKEKNPLWKWLIYIEKSNKWCVPFSLSFAKDFFYHYLGLLMLYRANDAVLSWIDFLKKPISLNFMIFLTDIRYLRHVVLAIDCKYRYNVILFCVLFIYTCASYSWKFSWKQEVK